MKMLKDVKKLTIPEALNLAVIVAPCGNNSFLVLAYSTDIITLLKLAVPLGLKLLSSNRLGSSSRRCLSSSWRRVLGL